MTNSFTKPMQPCNADPDKIKFPCVIQKKWDGMKLIIDTRDGDIKFLGRSMKPIKNQWVVETLTEALQDLMFIGGEGVILEGELQAGGLFENCDGLLSASRREFKDLIFHVFDEVSDINADYTKRMEVARVCVNNATGDILRLVESETINSMSELMVAHAINDADPALDGTIVRQPDMAYKVGKRTVNEGYVVKFKSFMDDEAEIIGFEELMHNENEGVTNPLGRTERSTAKAGLVPGDTLGAFICRYSNGKEFKIGSFKGMTRPEGKALWDRRETLLGKLVKFKFMRLTKYGVPLHPVYLGFRDPIDMDSDSVPTRPMSLGEPGII